jgi:hypothetical protein
VLGQRLGHRRGYGERVHLLGGDQPRVALHGDGGAVERAVIGAHQVSDVRGRRAEVGSGLLGDLPLRRLLLLGDHGGGGGEDDGIEDNSFHGGTTFFRPTDEHGCVEMATEAQRAQRKHGETEGAEKVL